MSHLFEPLTFRRGRPMRNRLALAAMTTGQSHLDGQVSEDEIEWLASRARDGFGMTLTTASHVQPNGAGVDGQLAIYSDDFADGLARLAGTLRANGTLAAVQIYHAGPRAGAVPETDRRSASDEEGARSLTIEEVQQLRDDFIAAAVRADRAGFDGVEVHGAHGFILTQFLSAGSNSRVDLYGGSLENRARLLLEVLSGIRAACRPDFQLGLRLSVERYGLRTLEVRDLVGELFLRDELDYVDLSLWDVTKYSIDEDAQQKPLIELFGELPRGMVRLGVAGKVRTPAVAAWAIENGADFAFIGRSAIPNTDFVRLCEDLDWAPVTMPVAADYLIERGVSATFVETLRANWGEEMIK